MNTPVLLIAWRRPHTLRQVIDAIRPIAPSRLFVACDGPNPKRPDEFKKVAATRDMIETEIDWPCQIERLYSDVNQGCRLGVSRAITWFFEHVEEGIILEDDCVPHPDFFPYCSTLLNYYRNDTRVWCISGSNFQDGQWRGDGSYYFSRHSHCWGWASWRRCWKHYDADLSKWSIPDAPRILNTVFDDSVQSRYWESIWNNISKNGTPDSWACCWFFSCLINGGLTALPNLNLVNNIGFGDGSTHTKGRVINTAIKRGLDVTQHPTYLLRDVAADHYTFDNHFGGKWRRFPLVFLGSPFRLARKIIHSIITLHT